MMAVRVNPKSMGPLLWLELGGCITHIRTESQAMHPLSPRLIRDQGLWGSTAEDTTNAITLQLGAKILFLGRLSLVWEPYNRSEVG
jgi:hypothetical protein